MAILAKLASPFPSLAGTPQPCIERAVAGKMTLFSAPAGYFSASRLSGLLHAQQIPMIWLRVGQEDRDPATLLLSLITGAEGIFPALGTCTREMLRRQPGGIYGWEPLFARLASDLTTASREKQISRSFGQAPFAIVVQHIDNLVGAPETMTLLWDHFLCLLPAEAIRVITSHLSIPRKNLPKTIQARTVGELRIDEAAVINAVQTAAETSLSELPSRSLYRLANLIDGRVEVLESILSSSRSLGRQTIQKLLDASQDSCELMTRMARCGMEINPQNSTDLLFLALRLRYLHPDLVQTVLGKMLELPAEWLQPLEEHWSWLRCIWREPLGGLLPHNQCRIRDLYERACQYLVEQGAYDQAIPLLLSLGKPEEAVLALSQVADLLIDQGQWQTLSSWLAQIPEPILHDWPWLVYTQGELAAARGQTKTARRVFSNAAHLFFVRQDLNGACQSLMAQGTLSSWENQPAQAEQFAAQAYSLAGYAGLSCHQGWAGWQLGRLAFLKGDLPQAITYLQQASEAANSVNEVQMALLFEQACSLAETQMENKRRKEGFLQAAQDCEQTEQEISSRLQLLLDNPSGSASELLQSYGWSKMPMFLKLPQPIHSSGDPQPLPRQLMSLLMGMLRRTGSPPEQDAETLPMAQLSSGIPEIYLSPRPQVDNPVLLPVSGMALPSGNPGSAQAGLRVPSLSASATEHPVPLRSQTKQPAQAKYSEPVTSPPESLAKPVLITYMLGTLNVILNDITIDAWPSGRARSVFSFLLSQYHHLVPRDVIMDTFWPEASPESARNSLNVAIYSLRHTLKTAFDQPVVLFHDNIYQINPDLSVWLDIDSFEKHVQAAHSAETAGQVNSAVHQYEVALNLYQGNFLEDNLYEEWPVIERERLRVLNMDALEHLSLIYLNQNQYASCETLCRRMLAFDSCREDAHCRLMRCYSRQGQQHLALRQYLACVDALHNDLDVSPSPTTAQLYEQIRRREPV